MAHKAAYLSKPNLLPLLTCHIVRSTLEDGVAKQSAYGFAVFGMVMNAAMTMSTGKSFSASPK